MWDGHRAYIWQISPQRLEDLALTRDARNQDVVLGHAGSDGVINWVAAHANALGDEHILRAAIRRITGEFAERALGLVHTGKDLTLDHDLGAGWHFEIANAALRQ